MPKVFLNEDIDVIESGVLEHCMYPGKSILEIKRVLKQEGYFFIYELPNIYSYGDFIRKLIKKGVHPVRYTRKGIEILLREGGYEIILSRYHSMLPKRMKHWEKLVSLFEIAPRFLDTVDNILSLTYPLNRLSQSIKVIAKSLQ